MPAVDRRLLAYPLLAVAFALPALAFWPGVLSPDSNQTVYQAGSRFATDWWTAFGSILLRVWLEYDLGFGFAYGAALLACVLGIYLCLRAVLRRVPAAAATVLIVLAPPFYAQLSELSRDTFFIGFTLLAFGALARWRDVAARQRRTLVAAAVACALLAFWSRQNGLVVVFAVTVLAALALWPGSGRRGAVRAVGIGAVAALATFGATQLLYSAFDVRRVHPERPLLVYDLASISTQTGQSLFPRWMQQGTPPGWVTPQVDEATLKRLYRPENVIYLYPDNRAGTISFGDEEIAAAEARVLRNAWKQAVKHHPLEYAWARLRLTAAQLGLGHHTQDGFGGLYSPDNYGRTLTFHGNYDVADDAVDTFMGPRSTIPLDLPWLWVSALTALGVVLWRRRRSLLALGLAVAVLGQLPFIGLLAPAASFRYLALAVPAALILLVHWAAGTDRVKARARGLLRAPEEVPAR